MDELFLNKVSSVLGINRLFINKAVCLLVPTTFPRDSVREWGGAGSSTSKPPAQSCSSLLENPVTERGFKPPSSLSKLSWWLCLHFCTSRTWCCPLRCWADLSECVAGPLQCQTGPRSLTSKGCAGDSCPMSPRVSKRPTPSGGDKSPRQFKTGYTRGFEDKILVTKFTRRARKDSHSPGTKHTCAICKRDSQWEFAVTQGIQTGTR